MNKALLVNRKQMIFFSQKTYNILEKISNKYK